LKSRKAATTGSEQALADTEQDTAGDSAGVEDKEILVA
jgi:hypothetical protein